MSGLTSARVVRRRTCPRACGPAWRQTCSVRFMAVDVDGDQRRIDVVRWHVHLYVLVARWTFSNTQRLLVQDAARCPSPAYSHAATYANCVVVAQRLAVLGLVLDAEVAAARFLALERVAAHQLAELEEVGDAARAARATG